MKLYVGPANSGKTERILSIVAGAIVERRRARLILPSAVAMSVMSERLAALFPEEKPAKIEQSLATFPSLYSHILNSAGRSATILNAVERERLLGRVISELADAGRLTYFKETADRAGLVSAMAGFVDELSRSDVDAAKFARLADARVEKNKDFALIYSEYSTLLDSVGAVDAEGAGVAALRALEDRISRKKESNGEGEKYAFAFPIQVVAVDGFDFYTPLQFGLLSALDRLGVEIIAALTYREESAVHYWQKRTRQRFSDAGADVIECSTNLASYIDKAADSFLSDSDKNSKENSADHIFIAKGQASIGKGHADASLQSASSQGASSRSDVIQIISAPDRAAEVRASAREIKRLVIEEGIRLDEIAIVCRSLSAYSHHLERVFDEYGIHLTLDCSQSLQENTVVIAMLRLVGLSARAFPRRATVDCLRSPYFDFSPFGLDTDSIDRLDRISLQRNVTRGADVWLAAIAADKDRRDEIARLDYDDDKSSEDERAGYYDNITAAVESFFAAVTPPRRATRKEYIAWINSLLERLRVAECAAQGETAARDVKSLERFIALVTALLGDRVIFSWDDRAASLSAEKIYWPRFYNELEQAVASASCDRPDAPRQSVVAQEAHHLRPQRYRAVFMLGLIEGEFPARVTETAPYASFEREELRRAGIDLAETTSDAGADLLQFYKAMSMAEGRLYLSFARTDTAGGELIPSYLVEEVKAVAKTGEARIKQSIAEDGQNERCAASLEELALHTAKAMRGSFAAGVDMGTLRGGIRDANALLLEELPAWKATLRGARIEQARLRGEGRDSFGGFILSPEIARRLNKHFGPSHLWSASQINDYGVCPFRFFARHALKLSRVDEPVEGFAANQLGHAYHRVLEKLFAQLQDERIDLSVENVDEAIRRLEEVAEEILEEIISSGAVRRGSLWEFEKREMKQRLARLIQREAEENVERAARPVYFERRFGIEGEPPLIIESEDGDINLCGIVDRIDRREDGSVVIDYKTGRTPIPYRDALEGRNLQLPIYIMAASRVINKGEKVAAAYYLHINSRKRGSELPKEGNDALTIESLVEHAERRIIDYVSRARRGIFPVAPNNDRCFQGCEFDVMCRIQSLGATAGEED